MKVCTQKWLAIPCRLIALFQSPPSAYEYAASVSLLACFAEYLAVFRWSIIWLNPPIHIFISVLLVIVVVPVSRGVRNGFVVWVYGFSVHRDSKVFKAAASSSGCPESSAQRMRSSRETGRKCLGPIPGT